MAESVLMVKSKAFALEVIRACRVLREARCESALINQFLRSGTSICANIREVFMHRENGRFREISPVFSTLHFFGVS